MEIQLISAALLVTYFSLVRRGETEREDDSAVFDVSEGQHPTLPECIPH